MSSERQFERTFSRRKKANPTDTELTDTNQEEEEGLQENEDDKATVPLASTSAAVEVVNIPSSSDSSRGESNSDATREPAAKNGESKSEANKLKDKQGVKNGGDAGKKQQNKKQEKKPLQQRNQKKPVKQKEAKKERGEKRENGDVDRGAKKKKKEDEEGEEAEVDAEQVEGTAGYKFPMYRIDKIIRSEGSDLRITNEAVFLINKAAEKFLEVFCKDSYSSATENQKNYVSYKNLSTVVREDVRLDFLADFVPEKVTAEKALAESKPAEKPTG